MDRMAKDLQTNSLMDLAALGIIADLAVVKGRHESYRSKRYKCSAATRKGWD